MASKDLIIIKDSTPQKIDVFDNYEVIDLGEFDHRRVQIKRSGFDLIFKVEATEKELITITDFYKHFNNSCMPSQIVFKDTSYSIKSFVTRYEAEYTDKIQSNKYITEDYKEGIHQYSQASNLGTKRFQWSNNFNVDDGTGDIHYQRYGVQTTSYNVHIALDT